MFFNTSGLQREGNGAEISPQITTAISIATLSSFSLGGKKHPEEGYGHPNHDFKFIKQPLTGLCGKKTMDRVLNTSFPPDEFIKGRHTLPFFYNENNKN